MKVGDILPSNSFGDFVIVSYVNSMNVVARFVDTGSEVTTTKSALKNGRAKDKLKPTLYGFGFIGHGQFTSKHGAYDKWNGMLQRCYSELFHESNPTYKGCTTCEEWCDYQVFAQWYCDNYPVDGESYELDKDFIVKGNKIYSPETCCFLTREENARVSGERLCKSFKVISPTGVFYEGFNQTLFAKEHGIDHVLLSLVLNGKRKSHQGWVKA